MKTTLRNMPNICIGFLASIWVVLVLAVFAGSSQTSLFAAGTSLIAGRVTSAGRPVAGIPVRAHADHSTITVSAYTDIRGEYSFPDWSAVEAGFYSVNIEVPDFEPIARDSVLLIAGKTTRLDLALKAKKPGIADATASEIAMAMPGTEDQRFLLSQCGQCHSLQFALRTPRTRDEWLRIVKRMAGARRATEDPPGTRSFDQKRYIEPMADYLVSIRGPGSSNELPFRFRARPTGEASTRIIVTEYEVPRGGAHDLYITRGDRRFVWPHDVAIDSNLQYVWYTDHFTNILGRLNRKNGEVKEFPFTPPRGKANANTEIADSTGPEDGRAGNPGGGAHKIAFGPDGNLIFGTGSGAVVFNPRTEEFKTWTSGSVMFGIDPAGNVWYLDRALHRLDLKTGDVKSYPAPPNAGGYDVEVDSKGRFVYNGWRTGKLGVFDPKTEEISEYPIPTPGSGPRRGEFDAKDRYWTSLYWAGRIIMFDPGKGTVKEIPILPEVKPFAAPFLAPYSVSVDDRNQLAWTTDLNSSRVYRFDMKTEKFTEYFMPQPYELRDLEVDRFAGRPTVWLPAYRPQSKIVKVELR